jgi:hypothetical protein
MDREDVGLRLFLAGMGLGMALMTFVVTFDSTSFYQTYVAPTAAGAMRPLGFVVDGGVLLSLAMALGGIACFGGGSTPLPAAAQDRGFSAAERLDTLHRMRSQRARRSRATTASHGST